MPRKQKKTKKHLLIDTYCDGGYSYKDYLEWCDEMEKTPAPEGSDKYWRWIGDMIDEDWINLKDNIKCGRNNGRCIVTGTLGLWWGRPDIQAHLFNSLLEAICECRKGAQDIQIWEDNGHLTVHGMHHDGTNVFEIRPVNERRATGKEDWEIEESKNPLWYTTRYPEYIY